MSSEGYGTLSARKLGSNLLCQGGKGERREGVKGQNEEGNLNAMKKKKVGKLWMNKIYYFQPL